MRMRATCLWLYFNLKYSLNLSSAVVARDHALSLHTLQLDLERITAVVLALLVAIIEANYFGRPTNQCCTLQMTCYTSLPPYFIFWVIGPKAERGSDRAVP